jgi:hypothetical protein
MNRMSRYPLEWGWEQPQSEDPSAAPNYVHGETLLGRRPHIDVDLVASGDLKCSECESGGTWGTTGHYAIGGGIYCRDCAVKKLGLDGLPGKEQDKTLRRLELKTR